MSNVFKGKLSNAVSKTPRSKLGLNDREVMAKLASDQITCILFVQIAGRQALPGRNPSF
jgi:hypothetical protein